MHKGFRDAVWAMGVLEFLDLNVHLVLAGDGPDRDRLEAFARRTRVAGRVHFLRAPVDLPGLLDRSDVVWVPDRHGGRQTALEALAAGRPVVGFRQPALEGVVTDGLTGLLISPGDKVGLARQTRVLLEEDALRRRLGEAGRLHALERFGVARLCAAYAGLYG
jgi:glycosyltransferase involved in cell wall biosynthesis